MRLPNLLTALADILAGFAASFAFQHTVGNDIFGFFRHDLPWDKLGLIGVASMCLYAGGVVLNDFFDAALDQLERPERPIPSGLVSRLRACVMGGTLLLLGVTLAFLSTLTSGWIALGVSALVLSYNIITKRNDFFGPLDHLANLRDNAKNKENDNEKSHNRAFGNLPPIAWVQSRDKLV